MNCLFLFMDTIFQPSRIANRNAFKIVNKYFMDLKNWCQSPLVNFPFNTWQNMFSFRFCPHTFWIGPNDCYTYCWPCKRHVGRLKKLSVEVSITCRTANMCSGIITVEVHWKKCNFKKLQFFTVDHYRCIFYKFSLFSRIQQKKTVKIKKIAKIHLFLSLLI